jgi:hypothetical protein
MKQFFIFTAVVFSAFALCGATMLAPDLGAGKLDYVQQNGKKVYADLRDGRKTEVDTISRQRCARRQAQRRERAYV